MSCKKTFNFWGSDFIFLCLDFLFSELETIHSTFFRQDRAFRGSFAGNTWWLVSGSRQLLTAIVFIYRLVEIMCKILIVKYLEPMTQMRHIFPLLDTSSEGLRSVDPSASMQQVWIKHSSPAERWVSASECAHNPSWGHLKEYRCLEMLTEEMCGRSQASAVLEKSSTSDFDSQDWDKAQSPPTRTPGEVCKPDAKMGTADALKDKA